MKHILFLLLISCKLSAQNNVAHFSYWKPKPGFDNGYKQHLSWHKENGDKWDWYGWYIISGPRHDMFVDATFNHPWSDFDHPVNPAGDAADNNLHTYPFGEYQGGCKMIHLPGLSTTNPNILQSKLLHCITLTPRNPAAAQKIIAGYKEILLTFKIADGADLNQLVLFIGLNSWEEFNNILPLQDQLSAIAEKITTETLLYKPELTLKTSL